MITVGILTVSDSSFSGQRTDESGPALREMVTTRLAAQVVAYEIVPDEQTIIEQKLAEWTDDRGIDLILTTGGTGFAPRDVTPEATRAVIEREAPGLMEAVRAATLKITPHAMLSRAVAGIRGQSLIVNLPGSPKAAKENLEVILPALPHGLEILKDVAGARERHEYKGKAG